MFFGSPLICIKRNYQNWLYFFSIHFATGFPKNRFSALLQRHPLPAARIVHRYTFASKALPSRTGSGKARRGLDQLRRSHGCRKDSHARAEPPAHRSDQFQRNRCPERRRELVVSDPSGSRRPMRWADLALAPSEPGPCRCQPGGSDTGTLEEARFASVRLDIGFSFAVRWTGHVQDTRRG